MSIKTIIETEVAHLEGKALDAYHALCKDFSEALTRLGVVHTVDHDTEEASADAHASGGDAGTVAGGTATVSGTDLKTGDGVHTDTAGSPPKGPK